MISTWLLNHLLELIHVLGGQQPSRVTAEDLRNILPRQQTAEGVETLPGGSGKEGPQEAGQGKPSRLLAPS